MGLRTHNDPIPDGERAFMIASTKKSLEEGDVPIKARFFNSKKSTEGGNK